VLVGEVTSFDESGCIDVSNSSSITPKDLLLRTDISRYIGDARGYIDKQGTKDCMKVHMTASDDPYILRCVNVTIFRGPQEEGFPFLEEPIHVHVLLTALSNNFPKVALMDAKRHGVVEWYADQSDHNCLLARLNLLGNVAREPVFEGEENSGKKPVLLMTAPGCENRARQPHEGLANSLKHWRRQFAESFAVTFTCCSAWGAPDVALVASLDCIVNQRPNFYNTFARQQSDQNDACSQNSNAMEELMHAVELRRQKEQQDQHGLKTLEQDGRFADEFDHSDTIVQHSPSPWDRQTSTRTNDGLGNHLSTSLHISAMMVSGKVSKNMLDGSDSEDEDRGKRSCGKNKDDAYLVPTSSAYKRLDQENHWQGVNDLTGKEFAVETANPHDRKKESRFLTQAKAAIATAARVESQSVADIDAETVRQVKDITERTDDVKRHLFPVTDRMQKDDGEVHVGRALISAPMPRIVSGTAVVDDLRMVELDVMKHMQSEPVDPDTATSLNKYSVKHRQSEPFPLRATRGDKVSRRVSIDAIRSKSLNSSGSLKNARKSSGSLKNDWLRSTSDDFVTPEDLGGSEEKVEVSGAVWAGGSTRLQENRNESQLHMREEYRKSILEGHGTAASSKPKKDPVPSADARRAAELAAKEEAVILGRRLSQQASLLGASRKDNKKAKRYADKLETDRLEKEAEEQKQAEEARKRERVAVAGQKQFQPTTTALLDPKETERSAARKESGKGSKMATMLRKSVKEIFRTSSGEGGFSRMSSPSGGSELEPRPMSQATTSADDAASNLDAADAPLAAEERIKEANRCLEAREKNKKVQEAAEDVADYAERLRNNLWREPVETKSLSKKMPLAPKGKSSLYVPEIVNF